MAPAALRLLLLTHPPSPLLSSLHRTLHHSSSSSPLLLSRPPPPLLLRCLSSSPQAAAAPPPLTPSLLDDFPSVSDESEAEPEERPPSEDAASSLPLPSYPSPQLTAKEKKELASYAHSLGKKLKTQQVGKSGVTPSLAVSFLETLEPNELLKIKVHGNCPGELSDVIQQLEGATGSVAVGQIGRSVILYRPSLNKMKKREAQSARKSWTRNTPESSDTSQGYRKSWTKNTPESSDTSQGYRKSWTRNTPESSDTSQGYRKGWNRKPPESLASFKLQKKGTVSRRHD